MHKFLVSLFLIVVGTVTWLVFFYEPERTDVSYGERKKYHCERAYLHVASDISWMLAPFLQTPNEQRETGAFITMEAYLQLNIVRLKHIIDSDQIRQNAVRSIVEQTLRDAQAAAMKRKFNLIFWTDVKMTYDLGVNELYLPRYYPVAKELAAIVGTENCVTSGGDGVIAPR